MRAGLIWLTLSMMLAAAAIIFFPREAEAIPTFARKYRTECPTCHLGSFPKLNSFGKAFRKNGYRIPAPHKIHHFIKEDPLRLGAPAWKQAWPEAIWPGDIPSIPPLVMRIRPELRIKPTNRRSGTDFFMPQEVEFIMGGTMGRRFSFWGEFALFENGTISKGATERAWFQWDAIFGSPWLNMKVGQFEIRANPFTRFRKYSLQDFLTSSFQSVPSIAGDDGDPFKFKDRQRGFELWGALDGPKRRGGLEYAIGLVNGNGSPAAGGLGTTMDNNSEKDVYWRLSYKFGGAGLVSGPAMEMHVPEMKMGGSKMKMGGSGMKMGGSKMKMEAPMRDPMEARNWVDNSIRLGAFGYYGRNAYTCNSTRCPGAGTTVTDNDANHFSRHGFDLDIWFGDLNLFGTYMFTRDRIKGFSAFTFNRTIRATVWFIEADYLIFPWLGVALRHEVANTLDDPTGFSRSNTRRLVTTLQIHVRPNIRIVNEAEFDLVDSNNNNYRSRLDFLF